MAFKKAIPVFSPTFQVEIFILNPEIENCNLNPKSRNPSFQPKILVSKSSIPKAGPILIYI